MQPIKKIKLEQIKTVKEMLLEIENNLNSKDFEKYSKNNMATCVTLVLQKPETSALRNLFEAVFTEKSLTDTLYCLGVYYLKGEGIERNNLKAIDFFLEIVKLDLGLEKQITAMAWHQLIELSAEKENKQVTELFQGLVGIDYLKWLRKIAKIHHDLGQLADAMAYYRQAHKFGCLEATLCLTDLYLQVYEDKTKVRKLLEKVINSEADFYLMSEKKYSETFLVETSTECAYEGRYKDSYILTLDQEHSQGEIYKNGEPVDIDDFSIIENELDITAFREDQILYMRLTSEQAEKLIFANGPDKAFIIKAYAKLDEIYKEENKEIQYILPRDNKDYEKAESFLKNAIGYGNGNAAYNYFLLFVKTHFSDYKNLQERFQYTPTNYNKFPNFYRNSLPNTDEIEVHDEHTIEKIKEAKKRFDVAVKLGHLKALAQQTEIEKFYANIVNLNPNDNNEQNPSESFDM